MTETPTSDTRRAPVVPPGSNLTVGYSCLALSFLGLGTLWPLMRAGVQSMPALWFGTTRLALASVAMFVVLLVIGRLRLPSRQDLPVIISVGVFMMGIYVSMAQVALQYVGAGRATLLGYTTPLWVTPAAALLLRERLSAQKLAGVLLGLAGLALLFNPLGFDWSDSNVVMGNGMMILCAISWAVCIVQMRTQIYRLEPYQLVPWQLMVAAICVGTAALVFDPDSRIVWTETNIWLIVAAGPVMGPMTLWAGTMTQRHLPAVSASTGLLGVPVVSTLIAWVFLDETPTWTLILGLVVILGGIGLVSFTDRRRS